MAFHPNSFSVNKFKSYLGHVCKDKKGKLTNLSLTKPLNSFYSPTNISKPNLAPIFLSLMYIRKTSL